MSTETQTQTAKFNSKLPFRASILSGVEKQWMVSYPTEEQWKDYGRKRKIRVPEDPKIEPRADLDLYNLIRLEGSADLDAWEAQDVIDRIGMVAFAPEPARAPDSITYSMTAIIFETTHTLRIPTSRQHKTTQSAGTARVGSNPRIEEHKVFFEPAAELYDKLFIEAEGYEGPVPINHKHAVMMRLFYDLKTPDLAENFSGPTK